MKIHRQRYPSRRDTDGSPYAPADEFVINDEISIYGVGDWDWYVLARERHAEREFPRIVAMRRAGKSVPAIAKALGLTRHKVSGICWLAGYSNLRHRPFQYLHLLVRATWESAERGEALP